MKPQAGPSRNAVIGFGISPSQALTGERAQSLQQDLVSLLSSLTHHPPQVARTTLDLRHLVTTDSSLAGKRFDVVLLVSITFDSDKSSNETKVIVSKFEREFYNLLALHLIPYEYRIEPLSHEQAEGYLQPFEAVDIVEITRRIAQHKPFELTHFRGNSPMTKIVDMFLREDGQYYLSVLLEPHLLTQEEIDSMEVFGFKSNLLPTTLARELLEGIPGLQAQAEAMFASFRMKIRVVGDREISQYLVNLVGSEISGQRDFFQIRPTNGMRNEIAALSKFEFTPTVRGFVKLQIPEILLDLVYLFRPDEVSRAFRLPTERISVSREKLYKTYYAPITNLPPTGLLLGTGEHPSSRERIPIHISPKDRKRHMYVIGKTGTGKSMMLLNMLSQDLKSNGVCLIDPHGDLVEAAFSYIPDERKDDVYIFDPSDTERVCGFNPIETHPGTPEAEKDHIVQELISMLLRAVDYDIEMYGPMAQQYTRYSCMTLMDLPEGGTLLEVPRLFSDNKFQAEVLEKVKNPLLKWWWTTEFKNMSSTYKSDMLGYFTSKFTPLVAGPQIRNVVGQRNSGFNFREIMDRKKILLVNLARGKIGHLNSAFLGTMILSRLLWSIMHRAWEAEEKREEFYLYIDEFQNFLTDSFEPMLSETRKYGLNLILAHQHLSQLKAMGRLGDKVQDAVFGNVGTSLAFRLGSDAPWVSEQFGPPVDPETLRNLENRYAVLNLLVNDAPAVPFTIRTVDVSMPTDSALKRGQRMKQAARLRNTSIGDIETEVKTRYATV